MSIRKKTVIAAVPIFFLALASVILARWNDTDDPALRAASSALERAETRQAGAAGATVIIASEANHAYNEKTVVQFHPSGTVYVAFNDYEVGSGKRSIKLYKYEGSRSVFVKNVSENNQMAYEPDMVIGSNGTIHIVWAEGANANADTQHIKYRTFDGYNWSTIATLKTMTITGTVGGHNSEKVDDVRLAVDRNQNVFVTNMIWPAARSECLSRYNGRIYLDPFPRAGRTKHASVAADANYVHVAWVGLVGSSYFIQYARRSNQPGSAWSLIQEVQGSVNGVVDRPFIRVNSANVPQLVYLKTVNEGPRDVHHRSWQGSAFSAPYIVSGSAPSTYHPPEIATLDNSNTLIHAQTWGNPSTNNYNWFKNGRWSGWKLLNTISDNVAYGGCALHNDGRGAIAYSAGTACMLVIMDGTGPVPPEPPPPDINLPPSAFFSFTPSFGLYPLNVTFNAQNSRDSDGQIVSYHWNFGDGGSGSGVLLAHQYMREGVFDVTLTVTDDDGASTVTSGEIEVFGISPPLNVQYQRHENRNLFSIEYLYRITWSINPSNEEVGAKIVAYRIFRKERGSSLGYTLFFTLPVGNQSSYEYLDRTLGTVAREYEYRLSSLDSAGRESELN